MSRGHGADPTTEADTGPTAEELFGPIEDPLEEETPAPESNETSPHRTEIRDETAADVFARLQATVNDSTDEVLSGDSPETIAAADDHVEDDTADDSLITDEDALDELLLTGRQKEGEFLWIDPGNGSKTESNDGGTARNTAKSKVPMDAEPGPSADSDSATTTATDSAPSLVADTKSILTENTDPTPSAESDSPPATKGTADTTSKTHPDRGDHADGAATERESLDLFDEPLNIQSQATDSPEQVPMGADSESPTPNENQNETETQPATDIKQQAEADKSSGILARIRSKFG